jgi:hypothetical protein
MNPRVSLRPEARWLVRQLAEKTGLAEHEVEQGILAMIERGHLRIVPGIGPDGRDGFEPVIKVPADD